MSSTNRGAMRNPGDYYITPQSDIAHFLHAFSDDFESEFAQPWGTVNPFQQPVTVLDPCAGGDTEHGMAYPEAIEKYSQWHNVKLTTVDIRDDSRAAIKGNYLDIAMSPKFDIVITNPPFNVALDIISKCLQEVRDGGFVIMLLRLNFFGSEKRSAWFKQNMPLACYVHSDRIGFRRHMKHLPAKERNSTDSIEYMHAVWQVGQHPKFTKMRVI